MASRDLTVTLIGRDETGKAFGSASKGAEGMGSKLAKYGKVAAVAFTAAAGATAVAGKALFSHGAELQQMGNKAETVFGDSLSTVQKWAKENAAAMGLTSRQTTGLAANAADRGGVAAMRSGFWVVSPLPVARPGRGSDAVGLALRDSNPHSPCQPRQVAP